MASYQWVVMAGSSDSIDETHAWLAALPVSERHRLLAVERRRLALELLDGRSTPVTLEELAAEIAARETEQNELDETPVERVALTLHHQHLPELAEAGVLEYDAEAQRIDPDS